MPCRKCEIGVLDGWTREEEFHDLADRYSQDPDAPTAALVEKVFGVNLFNFDAWLAKKEEDENERQGAAESLAAIEDVATAKGHVRSQQRQVPTCCATPSGNRGNGAQRSAPVHQFVPRIDHLDHIKQLVKRYYTTLVEDYDWEHLQINRDYDHSRKAVAGRAEVLRLPTGLNAQKIDKMWLKWGNVWRVVDYGIEFANYSGLDPDNGSRADPVLRWDFYSESQFEIWPVPASNGDAGAPYSNWVGFEGQKAVENRYVRQQPRGHGRLP